MTTRRWPRIDLALAVHVRFESEADAVDAETMNVSREGLFIAMESPVAAGTRVRVKIELAPRGEHFTAEGVVVRRQPDADEPATAYLTPGIAVYLTMTSPGYERWCDELLKKPGK
jgi:uncharacterized protein (TIGR02266 family)